MKRIFTAILLAASAALSAAQELPEQLVPRLPRKITIGAKPVLELVKDGKVNFEIVVPADAAPTAKFAGREAAELLGKAFGVKFKVLANPTGKCPAIIIGSPKIASKLGIDLAKFDRDGFVIKSTPQGVVIIGRDDPKKTERVTLADHATLFGTYDFLERFAGMRFYLPGDYGTVVPKMKSWALPQIDIYERPDFYQRLYSDWAGKRGREFKKDTLQINRLRHRYQTRNIYYCHGLRELNYGNRFGKSHPEYFALASNGKRIIDTEYTGSGHWDESHFCYSSKVKDEFIADAVSYLKGEAASVRGVIERRKRKVGWHWVFPAGGKFFSISPPDGVKKCTCAKCAPETIKGTPEQQRDHYWRFFRDVALGVKKAGVDGFLTVPCNYSWWKGMPPACEIPDNLILDFSMRGPWNELNPVPRDREVAELKAWSEKIKGKLLLWTYPGKYYGVFPGIPASTPRSSATFMKRVKSYALGCYYEGTTDYLFFEYLNFYIYGKVLWNVDVDVEKLLDEHHTLMFGPAAKQMKEFFESLERNWMKMANNSVDTSLGPVTMYPSETEMWNTVYSLAERKRLSALFDEAEKITADQPEFLARVKTLRREMWQPALQRAEDFNGRKRAIARWGAFMPEAAKAPRLDGKLDDPAWQTAEVITLISSRKKMPTEVQTTVRALRDKDYFYFGFECEDKGIVDTVVRPFDNNEIWKDSGVEVFLSPDKNRERCYQVMVNASGSMADLRSVKGIRDWSWNSKAEAKSVITPGKGWVTEIRIPRSSLPEAAATGMLANMTRRYTPPKRKGVSYVWGPFYLKDNNEVGHFGTLRFQKETEINLIKDGDFDREANPKRSGDCGAWWIARGKFPLTSDFRLKGKYALLLDSATLKQGDSITIQQRPPFKPDTEYELSFFARMENVKPEAAYSSGFYVRIDDLSRKEQCFPNRSTAALSGSLDWTPMTFRFKTSKTVLPGRKTRLSFNLRKATGKVWIDNVALYEVKKQ